MSTPTRGRGGGAAKASTTPGARGRGNSRGGASNSVRGRARGRGASAPQPAGANGAGLLQKLRTGTVRRSGEDASSTAPRGRGTTGRGQSGTPKRGRGNPAHGFNAESRTPTVQVAAVPASYRDFMAQMSEKFQSLKPRRDLERKRAIHDGFLADPDKKMSLANAITPVGTCTDMCPEFERVERIVQNMVDKTEKVANEASGRDMPAEERMIKRFRRSAAGYDEQLPSDIRTPETLRRTLDYLLDRVIGGGDRLASIHKFVWDRTRGIRNDFSIQQVTRPEDVQIAVDCYERIARFHVLSLHQLSNPSNLMEGEHFDAHQEREQLNNTLLSLMYYYDDNRERVPLPNEPEFRAYCILFELQALTPDLEERMQSWPRDLLEHPKVQTAFRIYAAAGNTVFDQGPLRPLTPFSIAQANAGAFWTILASQQVSYVMACVAEMNFSMVRFTALDALWRSGKSAPQGQQQKNQDWTLAELTDHLGFDDEEQTLDFVQEFGLAFGTSPTGEQFLDFMSSGATSLDRASVPSQQTFSQEIVEGKRYARTLVAVINGTNVATAIREGQVVETTLNADDTSEHGTGEDEQSMFVPEVRSNQPNPVSGSFGTPLNPQASNFKPSIFGVSNDTTAQQKPLYSTKFGETVATQLPKSVFGVPSATFPPAEAASSLVTQTSTPNQKSSPGAFETSSGQGPATSLFSNPFQNSKPSTPLSVSTSSTSKPSPASFTFGKPAAAFTPSAVQSNSSENPSRPTVPGVATFPPATNSQPTTIFQGFDTPAKQADQPKRSVSSFFGHNLTEASNIPQPSTVQQPSLPTFNFAPVRQSSATSEQNALTSLLPAFSAPAPQQAQTSQSGTSVAPRPTFTFPQSGLPPSTSPAQLPSTPSFTENPIKQTSTSLFATSTPPSIDFTRTSAQPPSTSKHEHSINETIFSTTATSTTPLGSPKRPQLGKIKFSTIVHGAGSTGNDQQPEQVLHGSTISASKSIAAQSSLAPPSPPLPVFTEADRTNLIQKTAHLALTQPQGLFEYIIGPYVSNILQKAVREYERGVHDTILEYVKTRHLARKFFAIWRIATKRKVLSRRGQQRRKLLAAAVQSDMEKRKRNEKELESILAATQETKRLQEETRLRKQQQSKEQINDPRQQIGVIEQNAQLAGRKRKGALAQQSSHSEISDGKSHKRSRTLSTSSESLASGKLASPSSFQSSMAGSRFTQSFFGQPARSQGFRRSLSSYKVDSTQTDYFKLKAMGIDPDTPLIPDTPKTLAERRQRQDDERKVLVSRIRGRDRGRSRSSSLVRDGLFMPPPPKPTQVLKQTVVTQTVSSKSGLADGGDDEFLRSLQAARDAMSQDAEWFRNATAALETEIKQQEDLKQKVQSSAISNATITSGGLISVNGYKFLPRESRSGTSLSRTERRIWATGAHGLATKPVGISREYSPVAMSRTSAGRLGSAARHSQDSDPSSPRKRTIADIDSVPSTVRNQNYADGSKYRKQVPSTKRTCAEERPHREYEQAQHSRSNRARASSANMFAALNGPDAEDEEADEEKGNALDSRSKARYGRVYDSNNRRIHRHELQDDIHGSSDDNEDDGIAEEEKEEEEEDDDDDDSADELYQADALSMPEEELVEDEGDTGDESDEEEDEEEDEEDEEEEEAESENERYIHHKGGLAYPVMMQGMSPDATAPDSALGTNTNFDRTGPGATEDDALVLSD